MKIKVTLEIEVEDISEEDRALMYGDADPDDTVFVDDLDGEQIASVLENIHEFSAELFAGSDIPATLVSARVLAAEKVD